MLPRPTLDHIGVTTPIARCITLQHLLLMNFLSGALSRAQINNARMASEKSNLHFNGEEVTR